jgi:hypothetical protein
MNETLSANGDGTTSELMKKKSAGRGRPAKSGAKSKDSLTLSRSKDPKAYARLLELLEEANEIAQTTSIPKEKLLEVALNKLVSKGKRQIKELATKYISGEEVLERNFEKFKLNNPDASRDDFLKSIFTVRGRSKNASKNLH